MKTETNELTLVVEQSGIEKTKGEAISKTLGEFFTKANEWNATIEALQINDISETGKMKMAREGRLSLRDMRLDAKDIVDAKREEVKAKMADYVLEDKLWLKSFQMVEATFKNLESKLLEKEKFAERKELERLQELEKDRVNLLIPYNEFCSIESLPLQTMSDEDFKHAFDKAKRLFDLDNADKERIEKERIAEQKAKEAEQERIRLENEKLKKEAEESARLAKIEADKRAKEESERLRKEAEERKALEEKAAKERAENEAKLKKAAEEKAKLEAELKAKKEAEEAEKKKLSDLAKKEAEEKRKADLAPQKDKITAWVDSFQLPKMNTDGFDDNAIEKSLQISEKFNAFKAWAKKEIKLID